MGGEHLGLESWGAPCPAPEHPQGYCVQGSFVGETAGGEHLAGKRLGPWGPDPAAWVGRRVEGLGRENVTWGSLLGPYSSTVTCVTLPDSDTPGSPAAWGGSLTGLQA